MEDNVSWLPHSNNCLCILKHLLNHICVTTALNRPQKPVSCLSAGLDAEPSTIPCEYLYHTQTYWWWWQTWRDGWSQLTPIWGPWLLMYRWPEKMTINTDSASKTLQISRTYLALVVLFSFLNIHIRLPLYRLTHILQCKLTLFKLGGRGIFLLINFESFGTVWNNLGSIWTISDHLGSLWIIWDQCKPFGTIVNIFLYSLFTYYHFWLFWTFWTILDHLYFRSMNEIKIEIYSFGICLGPFSIILYNFFYIR